MPVPSFSILDEQGRIAMLSAHDVQIRSMERNLNSLRNCGSHAAQIEALQEDRKRQNGTLDRLEEKLDGLIWKILAAVCAFSLALGVAAAGWIVMLLKH